MSIVLLLGGESHERPISLVSGVSVGAACLRLGRDVTFLDPATGLRAERHPGDPTDDLVAFFGAAQPDRARILPEIAALGRADAPRPEVVAILLHGGEGEGGGVQRILELLGLPFTGSGSVASTVAMDKVLTKRVLAALDVPLAPDLLWKPARSGHAEPPSATALEAVGGYPVVVKPIAGGSTLGVTIVRDASQWTAARDAAGDEFDAERGLLVERFIAGREVTVGILEDRALPVIEIVPREGFYDYARKYTAGGSEYLVPAPIDDALRDRLQAWSLSAFRTLGCRQVARADFRLDEAGRAYCLEINTVPGMTPTSLVPKAARAAGIEFDELCRRLLRAARGGEA